MAARRPPSRATSGTSAPSIPRSRSALARPTYESQQTFKHVPKQASEEADVNIQVVIRCRRRSEREIQDKSPIIVSSEGAKSQQVAIEVSTPASSLGVVSLAPVRSYPFDLVFGPEADQALIYHEVVSPMLEQVLQGYNCTLFAYGQTGTGKTYTMQGDLSLTKIGNPSPDAGMIPRVLFRLFHQLETSGTDYCVKISYVELYNEELRDLLAPELASNSQSNPRDNSQLAALKIFDDASKRGVFIQGLEEVPVKDSATALSLLTKGSERRQTAATKFNDHSSRSHSIFSITVHVKETSSMGDDLLKIGKLNLVDLAGSENIGRSGAENKRAREAGMINQSLLTLGRVINALVDKSQHVPYRESKLTRLLQDSLGGRTKTCIIATVSPARSNMEETLSTLDYAMHAKSIRNKPELNQRMTRNALLKEYVAEIERLKSDLLAAREKNGIFFSEEHWKHLTVEQELRQTELEEAKKQVGIVENQLRAVRDEFEQTIGILMKKEKHIEEVTGQLRSTEDTLNKKQEELAATRTALKEEVVVRSAYQENEVRLDSVATGLKHVAQESIRDLSGVFGKLDRKTTAFQSTNKNAVSNATTILKDANSVYHQVNDLSKTSNQHAQNLVDSAQSFRTKEMEMLATHSARIDEQLKRMQDALNIIRAKETTENEAITAFGSVTNETAKKLKTDVGKFSVDLDHACEEIGDAAKSASAKGFHSMEEMLEDIGTTVVAMVKEVKTWTEGSQQVVMKMKKESDTAAQEEIVRLRKQNDMLVKLVAAEKAKAEKGKDELLQRVSGLLGDFVKDRDESLQLAVANVQTSNEDGTKRMGRLQAQFSQSADSVSQQNEMLLGMVERSGAQVKRTWDGALKTSAKTKSEIDHSIHQMQRATSRSLNHFRDGVQKSTDAMSSQCTELMTQHDRAKRQRIDTSDSMVSDVQSGYRSLQRGVASTSRNIESFAGRVQAEASALSGATNNFTKLASTSLAAMQRGSQAIIEGSSREDTPVGTTPKKRVWQYVDQWELTGKREALLSSSLSRSRLGPISPVDEDTTPAQPRSSPREEMEGRMTPMLSESEQEHDETGDETEMQPQTPSESGNDDDTITGYLPSLASSSSSSSTTSSTTNGSSLPTLRPRRKATLLQAAQQKAAAAAQPLMESRAPNLTVAQRRSKRTRG